MTARPDPGDPLADPQPDDPPLRFADLQAAADATVDCMRRHGLAATATYDTDGWGHSFGWEGDEAGDARHDRIAQICADAHYAPVVLAWQALHAREIDVRDEALRDEVAARLRARGYVFDVLDAVTRAEIDRDDPNVRRACLVEALDALRARHRCATDFDGAWSPTDLR